MAVRNRVILGCCHHEGCGGSAGADGFSVKILIVSLSTPGSWSRKMAANVSSAWTLVCVGVEKGVAGAVSLSAAIKWSDVRIAASVVDSMLESAPRLFW